MALPRIARVWTIEILVFQLGIEIRITALSIARLRVITRLGILFRTPLSEFRGAHRNAIHSCVIRDNGFAENGYGIEIRGTTYDVEIRDNRIEDSGGEKQKVGIAIEREARGTVIEGNTFVNIAIGCCACVNVG